MKHKQSGIRFVFVFLLFLFCSSVYSNVTISWEDFVRQLRVEAIEQGIRPEVFDRAFQNVHAPNRSVLHLDKTQPEKRITYLQYRNTRVDPYRIKLGRREMLKHKDLLNEIGSKYGVNPCVITAIWGLETSYGRFRGNFPVIQSLATLAYDKRRSDYFRNELMIALHMLNDGQVSFEDFKGEWAGASGHCQFLPSTWKNYAVDYDQDGRADIWNNLDDALASIANFMAKNGWQTDQPWSVEINLPSQFDNQLIGTKTTKTVGEWVKLGVTPVDEEFPNENLPASIIYPEGGPAYMVFNNFKTILKWNRSNYYAASVGYLADKLFFDKP